MKKGVGFNCDIDGSIVVLSALSYCFTRKTYIVESVQRWIKNNWDYFDANTKFVIVRDSLDYLKTISIEKDWDIMRKKYKHVDEESIFSWKKFCLDRYCCLNFPEKDYLNNILKNDDWFKKNFILGVFIN